MSPQRKSPFILHPSPFILLFLLTLLSYAPAILHAGFIWDDPDYVTRNPLLRTPQGLLDIWTKPAALPQYYPLVHTTYWLEYQLVGLSPHLYHLDNALLHAANAILFYYLLKRLKIPAPLLAASLFATHPLMTESVAWITERKNTLSLLFYLASALTYLKAALPPTWHGRPAHGLAGTPASIGQSPIQPERSVPSLHASSFILHPSYFLSLALFLCALLSKTVTCSLPAALLLILWYKFQLTRKHLLYLLSLLPFFLIALPLALYTAHLEQTHVGATGPEFQFSPADPLLIAPRAILFYASKLLYPHPLSFIYPRWRLDPTSPLQWLPLVICLAITVTLAVPSLRNPQSKLRHLLLPWLLFTGTLTPALGFFNVFPMRYSFVADHFAYHATLAPLALIAAAISSLTSRGRPAPASPSPFILHPSSFILLFILAAMTFLRTRAYESPLTLWTDTVAKNPTGWMPHVNLGHAYVEQNNLDAAEQQYNLAASLVPTQPDALLNVAGLQAKRGNHPAALATYEKILSINPHYPGALFGIGNTLLAQNNPTAAIPYLKRAIEEFPEYAQAHYTLARAYEQLNDPESARTQYESAIAADPTDADSLYNLGTLYLRFHHPTEAAECFRRAIALNPTRPDYHANLGSAYLQQNNLPAALAEYTAAAKLNPALITPLRHSLQQRGITPPF